MYQLFWLPMHCTAGFKRWLSGMIGFNLVLQQRTSGQSMMLNSITSCLKIYQTPDVLCWPKWIQSHQRYSALWRNMPIVILDYFFLHLWRCWYTLVRISREDYFLLMTANLRKRQYSIFTCLHAVITFLNTSIINSWKP